MMITIENMAQTIYDYVESCNISDLIKLYNHLTGDNIDIEDVE